MELSVAGATHAASASCCHCGSLSAERARAVANASHDCALADVWDLGYPVFVSPCAVSTA